MKEGIQTCHPVFIIKEPRKIMSAIELSNVDDIYTCACILNYV
jgi:hypothetical protein